jgi:hypothetical protein
LLYSRLKVHSRYAQQIERELETELKNKDNLPRFKDVDNLIEE